MDDKSVNLESPPQPAKRCFVVWLGVATACGILAALTWQAALLAGFQGEPMQQIVDSLFRSV
jgi:hypothetical protein